MMLVRIEVKSKHLGLGWHQQEMSCYMAVRCQVSTAQVNM